MIPLFVLVIAVSFWFGYMEGFKAGKQSVVDMLKNYQRAKFGKKDQ
jgi:hypothetical protein